MSFLWMFKCSMWSGLEATRRIRAREKQLGLKRTPIIATTAHAMIGDREICFQAGMDGYLAKPFNTRELIEVVESAGQGIMIQEGINAC